jgi:hypothetical protein
MRRALELMPTQGLPDNFSIDYSQGMVSGQVALDNISMGNPFLNLTGQAIGLATNSTADFHSNSCDGVFVRLLPVSCSAQLRGSLSWPR